jgi:multidrug efflux pump subunit AcrB
MSRHLRATLVVVPLALALLLGAAGLAQAPAASAVPAQDKGKMMLTIFLKHDQSMTLEEIQKHLEKTGFSQKFPPPDVEVVSWYVMMGIGQVVTLRFPAEKLREVNLAIEQGAWGAYRTEFYTTYDYRSIAEAQHNQHRR